MLVCWDFGLGENGSVFGFAGEVGSVGVGGQFWGGLGAGEVGFCLREEMVWSGFMG